MPEPDQAAPSQGDVEALVRWAGNIKIDDGLNYKWYVYDASSAEPEVNWPGEMLASFNYRWGAETYRDRLIIERARAESRAEVERLTTERAKWHGEAVLQYNRAVAAEASARKAGETMRERCAALTKDEAMRLTVGPLTKQQVEGARAVLLILHTSIAALPLPGDGAKGQ